LVIALAFLIGRDIPRIVRYGLVIAMVSLAGVMLAGSCGGPVEAEPSETISAATLKITEEPAEELPNTGGDGYMALASYYGYELAGQPMASGIPFEPWSPVVASWDYPLGTELLICAEYCTTAVVLDRGPAPWTGKDIDLSLGVAYWSGLLDDGVGPVYVEEI
jgi:rare lipoprotein A (peptidoglycan hydrolase)